jgi:hypothetical protein
MEQCFWPVQLAELVRFKNFSVEVFVAAASAPKGLAVLPCPCSWPTLCFNQSLIAVPSATFRTRNISDVSHSSPCPAQHLIAVPSATFRTQHFGAYCAANLNAVRSSARRIVYEVCRHPLCSFISSNTSSTRGAKLRRILSSVMSARRRFPSMLIVCI